MIRLKAIRSATPIVAGSTALAEKDAEMVLEPGTGMIFIQRKGQLPRGVPTQFIVHLSRVERVEPCDGELDDIFDPTLADPEPVKAPESPMAKVAEALRQKAEGEKMPEPVKDDEERAIKINGTVEFRRGAMRPDEVAARAQAKKDRVEALLQLSEHEWTPEQRKMVEEYTASNPPDAVPTPPAPTRPKSIAELIKRE